MLETAQATRRESHINDLRWRWEAGQEINDIHDRLWAKGVRVGPLANGTGAAMVAADALAVDKSSISQFQKFARRVPWEMVLKSVDTYRWGWREWRSMIYVPDDMDLIYSSAPKHVTAREVEKWCTFQTRLAKRGIPPVARLTWKSRAMCDR
jgi:hypothetical protein